MYRLATFVVGFFFLASFAFSQVPQPTHHGEEASFEGLGFLPEDGWWSIARAVSADGSVVVGQAGAQNPLRVEPFRWENGEMESLGDLGGGPSVYPTVAYDVSADGSVVIGDALNEDGNIEAFRWEDGVMEGLGDLEGDDFYSRAYGVSADGTVIVGISASVNGSESFRWEDGEMEGIGFAAGFDETFAEGVSADGSVMVGRVCLEACGSMGFRWEDGEFETLGFLPDGNRSWARAISADGLVIVGAANSDLGREAFRWENGEMEGLGSFWHIAGALAVSGDGSVVVGINQSTASDMFSAFIWTEEDGMRHLQEVLEQDYGLDLTGWTLTEASGVSEGGTVIVGRGNNPDGDVEAWRAVIPFQVADEATPEALADVLSAPSPNPVSRTATFTLAVENGQNVTVEVFDVTGRRMQTVYEGALSSGMSETLTLDASTFPAGVYIIRAVGEDFTKTRRVTVVR